MSLQISDALSLKTADLVRELAQESRRLRNALPEFLRWKPNGDGVGISRIEDAFLFELDLEFLHNDFLLYRTLGQRTQTKPQEIIETSREILKALILMVSKIIRWGQSVSGAGWVVSVSSSTKPLASSELKLSPNTLKYPSFSSVYQVYLVLVCCLQNYYVSHDRQYPQAPPAFLGRKSSKISHYTLHILIP